jgi:hypothetical protein
MLYTFAFPTKADKVPAGSDWLHEVKYDGYRMMLIREQGRVRLISRGGHDWARRFPPIVTAALKLHQEHFVLDGETVVLGPDGVSDFTALHSGRHNERAQLYAFDTKTSGSCRSLCAKSTWHVCSSSASPAYSSPNTRRAKSAVIYSASPVIWASKASSRSTTIAPIPPGNAGTG